MRPVARRRGYSEGPGLGERLSEIVVFILIACALVYAGRWYFLVYRQSPGVALTNYLHAVKAGNVDTQYGMLSASTIKYFPTQDKYESQFPASRQLAGRLAKWEVLTTETKGDVTVIKALVAVRKSGQELYQASAETFNDTYILRKENGQWKLALDASTVHWTKSASR